MGNLKNYSVADFVLVHDPAFLPSMRKLTANLSVANVNAIYRELLAHITAVDAGEPSPITPLGGAALMIALLHVTIGTPLHITDELLALWAQGDGTPAECGSCGYRMPVSVTKCVLCGETNGLPGIFTARRAQKAPLN